jgi:hypothetical protein
VNPCLQSDVFVCPGHADLARHLSGSSREVPLLTLANDASMTLLCPVNRCGVVGRVGLILEVPEDLAGDDPFEASPGLAGGLAAGGAAGEVGAGIRVHAGAGQGDGVQGPVELAVAGSAEAVASARGYTWPCAAAQAHPLSRCSAHARVGDDGARDIVSGVSSSSMAGRVGTGQSWG